MTKSPPRCLWVPLNDPLYIAYHDQEWGVPVHDDTKQYEFLVLESAQAGLSWRTILHKRTGYRKAFLNFDYHQVARFGEKDVQRLVQDASIIRNRPKIEAAISNARLVIQIQKEYGSFSDFLWQFVNHQPIINHVRSTKDYPAFTPLSTRIAKVLKQKGMRFLGPTTLYSHLQAVGIVQDHAVDCFRYQELQEQKG